MKINQFTIAIIFFVFYLYFIYRCENVRGVLMEITTPIAINAYQVPMIDGVCTRAEKHIKNIERKKQKKKRE